jgi:hypothetical protein
VVLWDQNDELVLELHTHISNGKGTHILEDRKIEHFYFFMNEQASREVPTTFIYSHDRSFMNPFSSKRKIKGFHGYQGRWYCFHALCWEILNSQLSEDHGSNCSGLWNRGRTQKWDLRKKIMMGSQKKRKTCFNMLLGVELW